MLPNKSQEQMIRANIHATKMSISCNSFEVCASQTEYTKMVLESRDLLEIL